MDFIYTKHHAKSLDDESWELPAGYVFGFVENTGSANLTLTFSDGTSYTVSAGNLFPFLFISNPYEAVTINATGTTANVYYVT